MNADEIMSEWEKDSEYDDERLDKSAVATSSLHAKYLNLLVKNKLKLAKYSTDYNVLRQVKFKYYRGELTKQELDDRGWAQYQGVKPIRAELDELLSGDADLNNLNLKTQYLNTIINMLESIITQIKSRDFQISNAIKWKMFMAGN